MALEYKADRFIVELLKEKLNNLDYRIKTSNESLKDAQRRVLEAQEFLENAKRVRVQLEDSIRLVTRYYEELQ